MAKLRRYRRRRKAFSDRQERAIRSIALGPVETKVYMDAIYPGRFLPPAFSLSGTQGVPSAPTGRFAVSVFGNLPRNVSPANPATGQESSRQLVGEEFVSIGLGVNLRTVQMGTRNWRMRVTLVSAAWKDFTSPSVPFGLANTNTNWMREDTIFAEPTFQGFNTSNLNILKSFVFSSTVDGRTNAMRRMWFPITGKKRVDNDEDALRTVVYSLGGRNYYLIVEWDLGWPLTGTYTPTTNDFFEFEMETLLYFKDP